MWLAVLTVGGLVRALLPVEVVRLRGPSSFFYLSGESNCFRLFLCYQQDLMEWRQLSYLRRLFSWVYIPSSAFAFLVGEGQPVIYSSRLGERGKVLTGGY